MKKVFSIITLLLMAATGAWADGTYTIKFEANGNSKTVENVTLPHTFSCDYSGENGELDQIIKQLYGLSGGCCSMNSPGASGNSNVTAGVNGDNQFITISAPFEGNATVTGTYFDAAMGYSDFDYSLTISCPGYDPNASGGGSTPEPEPEPETLLTTITATAKEQASYSTANVATVSFSYTAGGSSAYLANWGWWGYGWSATVNAAEGYTITKCIFYDDANRTATDSEAPFVVETTEEDKTPRINGTPIDGGNMWSKGIKKIEVYGYVTPAGPQMRTLTGVPQGWQVQAGAPLAVVDSNADGSYSIEAGQPVLLVPSAEDKPRVKSVTLVDNSTPAAVLIESITLNKTATTISAGQTETLSVSSVTPDDATDQTVTWSSDNEAVATVDADGKVTAVAFGTANITATANDGSGVTATCAVTVSKVVTINQSDWGGWDTPITKDGVTVSAGMIDPNDGNLMEGGTFSTTLGNFTKIVVTATSCYASGTGWSGSRSSMTWEGTPASTVSFSGEFMGMGRTQTTIVCTIVPTN